MHSNGQEKSKSSLDLLLVEDNQQEDKGNQQEDKGNQQEDHQIITLIVQQLLKPPIAFLNKLNNS